VAGATLVTATASVRMSARASLTAIVLTVFFDGFIRVYDAQARLAGAFHLRNGGHGTLS